MPGSVALHLRLASLPVIRVASECVIWALNDLSTNGPVPTGLLFIDIVGSPICSQMYARARYRFLSAAHIPEHRRSRMCECHLYCARVRVSETLRMFFHNELRSSAG